jgi:hypothetical protein
VNKKSRKLTLTSETLRNLNPNDLKEMVGGATVATAICTFCTRGCSGCTIQCSICCP